MKKEPKSLIAIGRLGAQLGMLPAGVREAAAAVGVEPDIFIDGVAYFAAPDAQRIAARVRASLAGGDVQSRAGGLH